MHKTKLESGLNTSYLIVYLPSLYVLNDTINGEYTCGSLTCSFTPSFVLTEWTASKNERF